MAETLTINKTDFLNAYKKATGAVKTSLAKLVPTEVLNGKITDKVKSFEDACKVLKMKVPVFAKTDSKDEVAFRKLKVIIQALNEGWKPNWKDSNEYKYYPWWDMDGGFSLFFVRGLFRCTYVPSCLCFKNEELAQYAAKQFLSIYKDFIVS